MDIFINKINGLLSLFLFYKETIFVNILLFLSIFLAYKYRKKIQSFYFEQKRILVIRIKMAMHSCLMHLISLYEFNLLLPIWYILLCFAVFIFVCINWSGFNVIDWKSPSKESVLLIWLIILSIIPFGNCEILNFKFTSNNMLNNPNAKKISETYKKNKKVLLDSLEKELNGITSVKGGKNV